MVLSLIPKPKYEEEEAAVGLPYAQAATDFSDAGIAHHDLPLTLPEKILGKAVAILTPPEALPTPLKLLYRPILLGAVGLHALLFFAPMGGGHKAEKPAEKEKPLTITQVATGKAQPKLTKVPLSKLPPPTKPPLAKLDRPVVTPNSPVVKTPDAPTPPKTDTPPPAAATPQAATPPANLPNVTPGPPGGGAKAGDPFENFDINYPGATNAGAYYEASGSAPAAVESFFKGQSSKGFEIKEGASTAARKILAISKGGQSRFVGLFPDGSNTVYVLVGTEAEIPVSLDKLKKAKSLSSNYDSGLAAVATPNSSGDPEDFANPTPYFDETRAWASGVKSMQAFDGKTPEQAYSASEVFLKSQFKSVTIESSGFNGGLLYKMTNESGDFYFNIVPSTHAGGGSMAVTFDSRP
jgi:hypothetical protein